MFENGSLGNYFFKSFESFFSGIGSLKANFLFGHFG